MNKKITGIISGIIAFLTGTGIIVFNLNDNSGNLPESSVNETSVTDIIPTTESITETVTEKVTATEALQKLKFFPKKLPDILRTTTAMLSIISGMKNCLTSTLKNMAVNLTIRPHRTTKKVQATL